MRKGDTEGLVGWLVAGGAEEEEEEEVEVWRDVLSVNPSPRPFLPLHRSLSRIVTPLRVGVASPELLTLSVTHFHFIICPLHPRAVLCATNALRCDVRRCRR